MTQLQFRRKWEQIAACLWKHLKQTANDLKAQLTGNEREASESITSYEGSQLPTEALGQLSASVDQLNAGMQGLNAAIGSFSSNLGNIK